jgi:hypothetical protein
MTIELLTGEPAINFLISDLKSLVFPIPFPWLGDPRNLDIFWKQAAQSNLVLLVYQIDYTLIGQSMSYDQILRQESFGSLSLIQPSPPKFSVGDSITIRRSTAIDQKTHFVADKLIASNVERSLDKLTIALQEAHFKQDTLHVPPNEMPSQDALELPPAALRAHKLLIFDPSGRPSIISPELVGNPRSLHLADSTVPTPDNTVLDPTGQDTRLVSSSNDSWQWVDPPVIPDFTHKLTLSESTVPTTGNTVLDPTGHDGKVVSSSNNAWQWIDLSERISSVLSSTALNYGSPVEQNLTSIPTDPSTRATKLLGWNSDGSALQLYPQGGGQGAAGSPFKAVFFSQHSTLDLAKLPEGAGTSMSLALPLAAASSDLYLLLPKLLDGEPHVAFIFDDDAPHDPLEGQINLYPLLAPEKILGASIISNGQYIFTCFNPSGPTPSSISLRILQILAPNSILVFSQNYQGTPYYLQLKLGEVSSFYSTSHIHVASFEIVYCSLEIIAFHSLDILADHDFYISQTSSLIKPYSLLINFHFIPNVTFVRFSLKSHVLNYSNSGKSDLLSTIRFSASYSGVSFQNYYAHISFDCSLVNLSLKSNFLSFDIPSLSRDNLFVSFSLKADDFIAASADGSLFPILFYYPPLSSSFDISHSAQFNGCSFAEFFPSPSGKARLQFNQVRYSLATSGSTDFAFLKIPSNYLLFGHIQKLVWHSDYSSTSTGRNILFLQTSPEGAITDEHSVLDLTIDHLLLSWTSSSDFSGSDSQALLWQRFNVPQNIRLHFHLLQVASPKISFRFLDGYRPAPSPDPSSYSLTHILIDSFFRPPDNSSPSPYTTRYSLRLNEALPSNSFFLTLHSLFNFRGTSSQNTPVFGFDLIRQDIIPVFTLGFPIGADFDPYSQINLSQPYSSSIRFLIASYLYQRFGVGPLDEGTTGTTPSDDESTPTSEDSSPSVQDSTSPEENSS